MNNLPNILRPTLFLVATGILDNAAFDIANAVAVDKLHGLDIEVLVMRTGNLAF